MQKVKYKNKIFLGKSVEVESRKGIILQSVYSISQVVFSRIVVLLATDFTDYMEFH